MTIINHYRNILKIVFFFLMASYGQISYARNIVISYTNNTFYIELQKESSTSTKTEKVSEINHNDIVKTIGSFFGNNFLTRLFTIKKISIKISFTGGLTEEERNCIMASIKSLSSKCPLTNFNTFEVNNPNNTPANTATVQPAPTPAAPIPTNASSEIHSHVRKITVLNGTTTEDFLFDSKVLGENENFDQIDPDELSRASNIDEFVQYMDRQLQQPMNTPPTITSSSSNSTSSPPQTERHPQGIIPPQTSNALQQSYTSAIPTVSSLSSTQTPHSSSQPSNGPVISSPTSRAATPSQEIFLPNNARINTNPRGLFSPQAIPSFPTSQTPLTTTTIRSQAPSGPISSIQSQERLRSCTSPQMPTTTNQQPLPSRATATTLNSAPIASQQPINSSTTNHLIDTSARSRAQTLPQQAQAPSETQFPSQRPQPHSVANNSTTNSVQLYINILPANIIPNNNILLMQTPNPSSK